MLLQNKLVVVSGGAGLLGQKICRGIVEQGGRVVIADLDGRRAEVLVDELAKQGFEKSVHVETVDISDESSIKSLIDLVSEKYGRIDSFVNAAYPRNSLYGKKLEEVSYDSFCENVSMHLGGYFLAMKVFGLYFQELGVGNVINISSVYGFVAPRFEIYQDTAMTMPVEYAAIKAGVIQLTRYMVKYFKGKHIRFNCISPGGLIDKQPEAFLEKYNAFAQSKGMLDPKDILGSVFFLLSDLSEWITGQNIIVDDGWSL